MKKSCHSVLMTSISKRLFLFIMLALGIFSLPAQSKEQLEIVQKLAKSDSIPLSIRWNEFKVPSRIAGNLAPSTTQERPLAAMKFLNENATLWNVPQMSQNLALVASNSTKSGWNHLRYQQRHLGIPVEGKQLIVHFNASNAIRMVTGDFLPDIKLDTTSTISRSQAFDRAISAQKIARDQIQNTSNAQLVFLESEGKVYLAYKTLVVSRNPLGEFISYIDAKSGALIYAYNNLKQCLDRETYTANNTYNTPGTLRRRETEGPTNDAALDAAHNNAGLVYMFYNNKFGRCSYDNQGAKIVSSVHFEFRHNNAYWFSDQQQMVYGDGDGVVFSPISMSLDVVGHELTHAVTDHESDLEYRGQSGALNESLSDIFGILIDDDDFMIGEDVFTPNTPGDALRYLDNPRLGGQPDHMDEYVGNGGVHINSGIPNKAAFLMIAGGTHHGITVGGLGREIVGQIFYEAQVNWLTPTSDFENAMNATFDAVTALGLGSGVYQSVLNAWKAVGVYPCEGIKGVKSSRAGINNTVARSTFDGDKATFFQSNYDNWQYIEIESDCEFIFSGFRRMMTTNGSSTAGKRIFQGEGVSYSLDGRTWTNLTARNAKGWETYVNYGANLHAWHSVNYGWSSWLLLNAPVKARYIRFNWDGNRDALNEIELQMGDGNKLTLH